MIVITYIYLLSMYSPTKKKCQNIPMEYYYRSRDYQAWSYTGKAIIQPGEGTDVDGSTPPCDAYVLIYAFFCVGILFGMGLLLYTLATLYSERILAKALQAEGIITQKGR